MLVYSSENVFITTLIEQSLITLLGYFVMGNKGSYYSTTTKHDKSKGYKAFKGCHNVT